jgi:hypothetical protein
MKFIRWVVLSVILTSSTTLKAQFLFMTNNGAIAITGYNGPGGDVVIPDSTNGWPVTSILANAFHGKAGLTNLTLPKNLTNIDSGAFMFCANLTSIVFPGALLNVGGSAFAYCYHLTNVTVSASVTNIGGSAFYSCSGLVNISVDVSNAFYSSVDGVLFNKNQTTLILCPATKAGNYIIPNTVGAMATAAFVHCTNLTGVVIPGSVGTISSQAFLGCSKLSNLTISSGVVNIGFDAFANCSNLTNLTIPGTITNIGPAAFGNCYSLLDVTIPEGVVSISDEAFSYCTSLTNFTIPKSVVSLGFVVFGLCSNLTTINVEAPNAFYSSLDGVLFNQDQTTLLQYPLGRKGTYTVPDSVIRIGDHAFYGVTWIGSTVTTSSPNLTGITFGTNVTDIGESAFQGSVGLTNLVLPGSITNIAATAFFDCTNLTSIYFKGNEPVINFDVFYGVPDGRLALYYLPGTLWEDLVAYRPTVLWNPQMQTGDSNFGVRTGGFGFNITGTPDIPIVVEACFDMGKLTWSPLQSCTLTNGAIYFSDSGWTNSSTRFYRIRSP